MGGSGKVFRYRAWGVEEVRNSGAEDGVEWNPRE